MKTQKEQLLALLQTGRIIDNHVGLKECGIYAVSQRMGELIADGWPIEKYWKEVTTSAGVKTRVRVFWINQRVAA